MLVPVNVRVPPETFRFPLPEITPLAEPPFVCRVFVASVPSTTEPLADSWSMVCDVPFKSQVVSDCTVTSPIEPSAKFCKDPAVITQSVPCEELVNRNVAAPYL